jgi:hypothetical protein
MERTPVPSTMRDVRMISEKQLSYLEALRDGKDLQSLDQDQRVWLDDFDLKTLSKDQASRVITRLKELPWKPREMDSELFAPMWNLEVPSGRYAIPGDDGALRFYSVKRLDDPPRVYVDVWASDARWPIKAIPQRIEILKAIKEDPDAGPRFGREIGKCYVCGRTLTDETSRALGIGPVCRGAE